MGESQPPRPFGPDGRYELVEELGSGGMGTVYKAWEPGLRRFVAIKVLRREDPDVAARFAHEAELQARVEHEGVCPVHNVGIADGRPYIVMQHIDGRSLRELESELGIEEKVRLMKRVAEAVHAANRLGLIHRDIKPGNILVERTESGGFKPYVLDFGLAQDQQSQGLTRTGQIMGTPQYMAPEQARGEVRRLDRRTDVYSLGAVLYELLGGRPPHHGTTDYEVLVHVAERDAASLRAVNPSVPSDLATIVMKCLEREPERRYESARALAEDLDRFLDGEPIVARAATLSYLIGKKLRRHRAETAIAGVALVVILILLGGWLRSRWREVESAALAQRFGQQAEQLEGFLRFAYSLPLHDTDRERAIIRERMSTIEQEMERIGRIAVGPGHFALGRGYLALQEHGKARHHLQRAWDAGAQLPGVAFALGRALGELYQEELKAAQRVRVPELRQARMAFLEETFRRPALEYLQRARGATTVSAAYGEGLVALYEQRFDDALDKAEEAVREAPWLYEAAILAGDAHMAIGGASQARGEFAIALEAFQEAGEEYSAAAQIARSDPRVHAGMNARWVKAIEIGIARGDPIDAEFEQALAAIDRAVVTDPGSAALHVQRAVTLHRRAESEARRGGDAAGVIEAEIAAARRAVELAPDQVGGHHALGTAHLYRAFAVEMPRGLDPRGSLAAAEEALGAALAIEPGYFASLVNLGTVRAARAEYAIGHGLDPRDDLSAAIESFEEVLRDNPRIPVLLNNLGNIHYRRGQYLERHGEDPRGEHRRAIEVCEGAVEVNPSLPQPLNVLGANHVALARFELQFGRDPEPAVRKALEALDRSLAANPRYAFADNNAGEGCTLVARYRWLTGAAAGEWLDRAEERLRRAIAVNPATADEFHANLGSVLHLRALLALDGGRAVAPHLRAARTALEAALRVNPRSSLALVVRGQVEVTAAREAARRGGDPRPALAQGEAALAAAGEINPGEPRVWSGTAALRAWECALRAERCPTALARGLEAAGRACEIDPDDPLAIALRGLLTMASAATSELPTRQRLTEEGRRLLDRGLELNPLLRKDLPELISAAR